MSENKELFRLIQQWDVFATDTRRNEFNNNSITECHTEFWIKTQRASARKHILVTKLDSYNLKTLILLSNYFLSAPQSFVSKLFK